MSVLRRLSRPTLRRLATALVDGRVDASVSLMDVGHHVPDELVSEVRTALRAYVDDGMAPRHIAVTLRLLAEERQSSQTLSDSVELVWSGTNLASATTRDTGVVVQQLFREAKRSILVSTYAIDQDHKAAHLFGELAARMDAEPDLDVRFFLNIPRPWKDTRSEDELVHAIVSRFRGRVWPGERLPEVFHDPRTLEPHDGRSRTSLHAKCVVIDDRHAFITSANFTEAAQDRNIEAGVLLDNPVLARGLRSQFEGLVGVGALVRVVGL